MRFTVFLRICWQKTEPVEKVGTELGMTHFWYENIRLIPLSSIAWPLFHVDASEKVLQAAANLLSYLKQNFKNLKASWTEKNNPKKSVLSLQKRKVLQT